MNNSLKPVIFLLGGFFYILLSGCSSLSLQSENLLANKPRNITNYIELKDTPFNSQSEYQCGPSALATLLQYNNLDIQHDKLVPEVYLPQRKGSLQVELIAATRRHNLLPYVIDKQMLALLRELQAGNPVLVLQNLGLDWFPQWHYAVVIGFNLEQNQIYLRSGEYRRHVNSFSLFEKTWQRANYWGMVVMPLDRLPATSTPFRYLTSAVAFEKLGKLKQAETAYNTALQRWPGDKNLLMASGNINYKQDNIDEAEKQYRRVIYYWPDYAPALNNLAHIQYNKGNFDAAEKLIRQAIQYGGKFQEKYQETLSKIQKARKE